MLIALTGRRILEAQTGRRYDVDDQTGSLAIPHCVSLGLDCMIVIHILIEQRHMSFRQSIVWTDYSLAVSAWLMFWC